MIEPRLEPRSPTPLVLSSLTHSNPCSPWQNCDSDRLLEASALACQSQGSSCRHTLMVTSFQWSSIWEQAAAKEHVIWFTCRSCGKSDAREGHLYSEEKVLRYSRVKNLVLPTVKFQHVAQYLVQRPSPQKTSVELLQNSGKTSACHEEAFQSISLFKRNLNTTP